MKVMNIQPSAEIIALRQKHIELMYEIEHLCSAAVWEGWKEQELVDLRSDTDLRLIFEGLIPRNKSLDVVIDELIDDAVVRDTILSFEPKNSKRSRWFATCENNLKQIKKRSLVLKEPSANLKGFSANSSCFVHYPTTEDCDKPQISDCFRDYGINQWGK